MRLIQGQRFSFILIVNTVNEMQFALIRCLFSGQRCLVLSVPGSGRCWELNWSPQWIFHVPDMNTQVRFVMFWAHLVNFFDDLMTPNNFPVLSLDVLLCHDDELEGRRVAFILYLVPPWQSSDGGTLDLYSTDSEYPAWCVWCVLLDNRSLICSSSSGNFQPQSIVKSIVPSSNTLVLFEVSPVSFHQVRRTSLSLFTTVVSLVADQ